MNTNALNEQVSEYVEAKERLVGTDELSPATIEQYRSTLTGIWLPWCKEVGVTEAVQATDKVMDRFTAHLKAKANGHTGKPLSPVTVRTYVRSVRLFLNWAKVPKGDYKVGRKARGPEVRVLSRQEIDAIEAAALDLRDKLIVRVLADTGIRVGELLGLRPEDLRANNHDRKYALHVSGKTGERNVTLDASLYRRLAHYVEDGPKDCGYIFCGKRRRANGQVERLTKSGVDQLIRNLALRAKIGRRVWPHLFRHSYITHMGRKSVNSLTVMHQVGHKSLAMISEIYSHLTADDTYDVLTKALRD